MSTFTLKQGSSYIFTVTFPSSITITNENYHEYFEEYILEQITVKSNKALTGYRYFHFTFWDSSRKMGTPGLSFSVYFRGSTTPNRSDYKRLDDGTQTIYNKYYTIITRNNPYLECFGSTSYSNPTFTGVFAEQTITWKYWYNKISLNITDVELNLTPIQSEKSIMDPNYYILPNNPSKNLPNFTKGELNVTITKVSVDSEPKSVSAKLGDTIIQLDYISSNMLTYYYEKEFNNQLLKSGSIIEISALNSFDNLTTELVSIPLSLPNYPKITNLVIQREEQDSSIVHIFGSYEIDNFNEEIYEAAVEENILSNTNFDKITFKGELFNNTNNEERFFINEEISIIENNEFKNQGQFEIILYDIDMDSGYTLQCSLIDNIPLSIDSETLDTVWNESIIYEDSLSTAFFTLDISADGKGIGVGAIGKDETNRWGYIKTTDIEVNPNKTYYTHNILDDTYTVVQSPTTASLFQYFEYAPSNSQLDVGIENINIIGNLFIRSLAGVIQMYAGSVAPAGWLLCDGSAVSRTAYAELFAAIRTAYGAGDGTDTFNLPDLRGRFPLGANNDDLPNGKSSTVTTTRELGNGTGGAEAVTLKEAELPSISGYINMRAVGSQSYPIVSAGGHFSIATLSSTGTGAGTGESGRPYQRATYSFGSGDSHNNMPPFRVVNYIICTGKTV